MRSIILTLIATCLPGLGAACTNTTFSGFTAVQCASATLTTATSINIVMGSNITSGNVVTGLAVANGATTLSISGSSCQSISFTTSFADSNKVMMFAGKPNSTGSCTVVVNSTNSVGLVGVAAEISGTNGTLDGVNSGTAFNGGGCNVTPCTITAASVTTTVNGDLIVSGMGDENSQGGSVTANSGSILVSISNIGIQAQVQSSAGAISPTVNYNSAAAFFEGTGTVAIEASGGGTTSKTPARGFGF